MSFLDDLKYDANGLITVVTVDAENGQVLMVAYMNREALTETLSTGFGTYYSRSRREMWRKGETSGHRQKVLELRLDCDLDCVLLRVEQLGGACHTGHYSCFYRKVEDGKLVFTA